MPEVKAFVTEHQMIESECPCCGERTKADAPQGVTAPTQYGARAAAMAAYLWHGQFLSRDRAAAALADMFGCAPSPGAIAQMNRVDRCLHQARGRRDQQGAAGLGRSALR